MFGDRLQLARKKAGLSLRGLADAMGGQVTPQALGHSMVGFLSSTAGPVTTFTAGCRSISPLNR